MQEDDLKESTGMIRREVYEAHRYITEHFMEPLTWENVADHIGLSGNYLRSLYMEAYAESLSHTITDCRMRFAARLLVTTTRQVQEIGDEAMFGDTAYFCRKFKAWYGMTPTQYRKKYSCVRNCENFVERIRAAGEE